MAEWKSPYYAVEELTDGVHAAIASPDGYSICNSGLVDLNGERLVFDTSLTPDSARDLRSAAEKVLGRPLSLAALSHWHFDHSLGGQEFSGMPLWGTRRTREILLESHDQLMAELTREQLEKDIRTLEGRLHEARSPEARADVELFLRINRGLLAAVGTLRLTPPDHTFETRLELPGRRGAELVSFGSGHTDADALLFLPGERVLFTGDLAVINLQPSMGSGNPEHWLEALDQAARLRPERIVPGHGPVANAEGLQETREYVAGILEAAQASPNAPLPRSLRRWEGTMSLEENLQFARGWLAEHHSRK